MTTDLTSIEDQLRHALAEAAAQVRAVPGEWTQPAGHRRHQRHTGLIAVAAAAVVVAVATLSAVLVTNQPSSPVRVGTKNAAEVQPGDLPSAQADLEVFMRVDATDAQVSDVRSRLESSAVVSRFAYVDRTAALADFRRIYAQQPDLVRNITSDALPTSFRLVLQQGASPSVIQSLFGGEPGVDAISDPKAKPVQPFNAVHDHANLQVDMTVDATDAQIQAVRDKLKSFPEVASVAFFDRPAVFALYLLAYRNDPTAVQGLTAAALPVSFRIVLVAHASPAQLQASLHQLPGVNATRILSIASSS